MANSGTLPDFINENKALRSEVVLPIDKVNTAANRVVEAIGDNTGKAVATTVMLGTLAHGAVGLDSIDASRAYQPHADIHHVAELPKPKIAGLTAAKFVAPAGESADIIAKQTSSVTHLPENEVKQAIIAGNNLDAAGDITPGSVIEVPKVVLPAPPVTSTAPALGTNSTPEAAVVTPEVVKPPTIYMIGDSISEGLGYAGIVQDYANNGWAVSKLEDNVGLNVGESIPDLEVDATQVAAATHIVVELGTNNEILGVPHPSADSVAEFQGQIQAMIAAIKKINPTAEVTWVNVHAVGTNVYESINQALQSLQSQLGYNIADWDAYAKANPNIEFDHAMGVHPDDYNLMAQFLVNFIGKAPVVEAPTTTTTVPAPTPTTQPKVTKSTPTTTVTTPPTTVAAPAPTPKVVAPPAPTPAPAETGPTTALEYAQQAFNQFMSEGGYSPGGAAGAAGNGEYEGGNPMRLQGSAYGSQISYTQLTPYQLHSGAVGWDEYQETPPDKEINEELKEGNNPDLLSSQVSFVIQSIKGTPLEALLKSNIDPAEAAKQFELQFERPQGANDPAVGELSSYALSSLPGRQAYAAALFTQYNQALAQAQASQKTQAAADSTTTSTLPSHTKRSNPTGVSR